jgi:hypothetical protein
MTNMVIKSHTRKISVASVQNNSNIMPYFRQCMNTGGKQEHKMITEGWVYLNVLLY